MPTIIPNDDAHASELATRLIDAADGDPTRVKVVTSGPVTAFAVDDELAAAIGAGTAVDDASDEPTEPEKPRRPARPKKTDHSE